MSSDFISRGLYHQGGEGKLFRKQATRMEDDATSNHTCGHQPSADPADRCGAAQKDLQTGNGGNWIWDHQEPLQIRARWIVHGFCVVGLCEIGEIAGDQ